MGTLVNLSARALGSIPITYQWQLNGKDIVGATNVNLPPIVLSEDVVGAYRVLVSNRFGDALSSEAYVLLKPSNDDFTNRTLISGPLQR